MVVMHFRWRIFVSRFWCRTPNGASHTMAGSVCRGQMRRTTITPMPTTTSSSTSFSVSCRTDWWVQAFGRWLHQLSFQLERCIQPDRMAGQLEHRAFVAIFRWRRCGAHVGSMVEYGGWVRSMRCYVRPNDYRRE